VLAKPAILDGKRTIAARHRTEATDIAIADRNWLAAQLARRAERHGRAFLVLPLPGHLVVHPRDFREREARVAHIHREGP